MSSQTLKLSKQRIDEMRQHYQDYLQSPVQYSEFRAKKNGVTITAYTSGKVLFQGNNADQEANLWGDIQASQAPHPKTLQSNHSYSYKDKILIGSDEVGNGSYFGPLTVCAAYVSPANYPLLKELGIKDSKLLSDTQIRELAWQIKASIKYHLTICPPEKYNAHIERLNAVGIKVSLHNFTIQKLVAKLSVDERSSLNGVLIDQFTPPANYLKHLKREQNPYTENLIFEKKAESLHLAVACASIIARDAFLESLETLGKPYQTTLPSGAGANVDKFGRQLVAKFGPQVLKNTAKLHFRNTQKILK